MIIIWNAAGIAQVNNFFQKGVVENYAASSLVIPCTKGFEVDERVTCHEIDERPDCLSKDEF